MSKKTTNKSITRVATFQCNAPGAGPVFVAGDFNRWSTTATPLQRSADGNGGFAASIALPPGRYEYKFLVDGMWCCKPGCYDHAPGSPCSDCAPNPFGTMNRVIDVT